MPKVNYVRKEVESLRPRWDLVRDCVSGEKAVKDKGVSYLPKPNPTDTSEENSERYKQYKTRAVFYNVTARTLAGFTGQVFSRDPVVKLPATLDILKLDVDGGSVSLDQQARKALASVLAYGRCGILTDYPQTEAPTSRADLEAGNIRPFITFYDAWDIINWRLETIGGKKLLSLVVISEKEVVDDDGFEQEYQDYYRVLRLFEGSYWSEEWIFDKSLNDFILRKRVQPLDASGRPWREIPFQFIGAENNDPNPDLPPLYDLAVLNIAHYRNSADYEEACFVVGQPTPYFAGLTESWVKDVLKGQVQLGARGAVPLPEGGTAGLLQASANTMPKEAMESKERQMVALGAKLVEQKAVQRTATEAGMEEASTTSVLGMAAKNVGAAYTAAMKWAYAFIGSDEPEISLTLNTDFDISRMTPAEAQALIGVWQGRAISFTEVRRLLKLGRIAYQEDEEAKSELESESPDLGLNDGGGAGGGNE